MGFFSAPTLHRPLGLVCWLLGGSQTLHGQAVWLSLEAAEAGGKAIWRGEGQQ